MPSTHWQTTDSATSTGHVCQPLPHAAPRPLRRRGLYRHHHAARRRPAAAGQEPGRPRAHRGHGYHVVTAVCSSRRLLAHSGSSCPRLTDLKPVRSTCAKLQFANSSVNGRIVIIHLLMTDRALSVLVSVQPINTKYRNDADTRDQ